MIISHLHPDERFLSMVLSSISPLEKAGDYFNTEVSSLNPANRGYGFFVYGTLPIFIIRYLGEWLGQTGYDAITILGRQLSAIMDLLTVALVFFIGRRLFSKWVGLMAASFYALMVLPIQLSHFMTVDTFTNTFGMLTVYIGVRIATTSRESTALKPAEESNRTRQLLQRWLPYVLFGLALGMATASKINAVSLALFLVLIEGVRVLKTEKSTRMKVASEALINLLVAGIISFLTFRIFQPYAFDGPGFFNFSINSDWWSSMQSLSAQAAGEVDFPPALQWARRPLTFAWTNMVQWGMGLPLGIFSWLSFFGMAWSIFKKRNWHLLPLWGWTGFYSLWQGLAWVRSMRYQILVYPLLALIAAWGLQQFWQSKKEYILGKMQVKPTIIRTLGIILGVLIICTSALWAFAFTRVYTQPHTRVAASDWIYQNIPGPINLVIETEDDTVHQPLPYRSGTLLTHGQTYQLPFSPFTDAVLTGLTIPHVVDQSNLDEPHTLQLSILELGQPGETLVRSEIVQVLKSNEGNWQGNPVSTIFANQVVIRAGEEYAIQVTVLDGNGSILLNGAPELALTLPDRSQTTQSLPKISQVIRAEDAYSMDVFIAETGQLSAVTVPHLLDLVPGVGDTTLQLTLNVNHDGQVSEYFAFLKDDFSTLGDGRGHPYKFTFDSPVPVESGQSLNLGLNILEGDGSLALFSMAPVHESSWDDALPLGKDFYYPYDDNGGIYRGDLNLELYWPDEASKLTHIISILDQADTIFISSNRQWGTTTRVPERYPLTSEYYRALMGCPKDEDLVACYNRAVPGDYESELGFELVSVFESYPTLGGIRFNSQFAEEAFTVYDAPKVLIFTKTSVYDPLKTRSILGSVDLSRVKQITARQASDLGYATSGLDETPRANLILSEDRLAEQSDNGTWSELFNRDSLVNTSPAVSMIAMYLFISMLGLLVYPLSRIALPGLADKGYALTRMLGILLLGYLTWLAGSIGIPYQRLTILLILAFIALIGIVLFILNRDAIRRELKANWKYILLVEALALLAFVLFLYIRAQNPDLWHPYKGGEKPMDFSYFNAILKSTTFPPYDPWFSGGYINYYYFGLMLVSVPVKLLGIIPASAYNIILPLLFSCLVGAAFSLGWNIYQGIQSKKVEIDPEKTRRLPSGAVWSGLATVFLLAIAGNLGTLRLLVESMQKLGAGGALLEEGTFIQSINWFFQGFLQFLRKTPLQLYPGDWYWVPSRAIPGEAITEFPYFTFLYADLHAHLIAMPIVLLSISWGISFLFARGKWSNRTGNQGTFGTIVGFLVGAMVIGALKPANTWDYYTFLILNLVIMAYVTWRYNLKDMPKDQTGWLRKAARIVLPLVLLFILTRLLYYPFDYWFGQGYSKVGYWTGEKTPLSSYLVHWGVFLFILVSWMVHETLDWMATTPISALKKLKHYQPLLIITGLAFLLILIGLLVTKVFTALIIIPVGVWVLLLLLRPNQTDGKKSCFSLLAQH